jgi:hypothetical protein
MTDESDSNKQRVNEKNFIDESSSSYEQEKDSEANRVPDDDELTDEYEDPEIR